VFFTGKRTNLMADCIVVENAIFVVSDQSLCCQLVNYLFKQQGKNIGSNGFSLKAYLDHCFKLKHNNSHIINSLLLSLTSFIAHIQLYGQHRYENIEHSLQPKMCPLGSYAVTPALATTHWFFSSLVFRLFYTRPFCQYNLFQNFDTALLSEGRASLGLGCPPIDVVMPLDRGLRMLMETWN
jgi:hypothetical protein